MTMRKQKRLKAEAGEANQVFRQFAWNLAGTLAKSPPAPTRSPGGKGEATGGKRETAR